MVLGRIDAYDMLGNRTATTDAFGNAVCKSYDPFGRVVAEWGATYPVRHAYDTQGRRTSLATTRDGATWDETTWTYDAYGRLVRNGDTCYTYAHDGLLATVSNAEAFAEYAYTSDRLDAGYTLTLTNGTVFSRTVVRDAYRRAMIVAITNSVNGVPVETFAYVYDALGRPTSRCRGVGGSPAETDIFGYNARSEVTNAIYHSPFSILHLYGYDDIGNSTNWPTNCLNQYTLCGSVPPCEFSYDLDGNMLSDGNLSFTYDAANRLLAVSSNDVLLASFAYDSQGRRVRKVTPTATHLYFYDGWHLVRETTVPSTLQPFNSSTDYVWGKDLSGTLQGAGGIGGLLYLTVSNSNSQLQLYIPFYDNNGNVTRYCDSQGTVVSSYTYDAFGNLIAQSGPMADDFAIRFSTKYHDREIGLYYYGYRYYHPPLYRWLNRDPIGEMGGANLYAFCGNNGPFSVDYLGMAIFIVMNSNNDVYELNLANCKKIIRADLEKLDKMGEKQFDKLVSCKRVAFNGDLFSGSFSEFKLLLSRELQSCIHVESKYLPSISKLQTIAQTAEKSYDLVAYCAHGSLWAIGDAKVSVAFSDCILSQASVIESANNAMSSAKGSKMVVSCYQTWDGKGDASKTKERLMFYTPGLNMISLKSPGNETSSDNKNPSDDKKDVFNFDVIRVEKVFGAP